MSDKLSLEELKASYKGRGGGPESESIIIDSNLDKRDNYVSVYSSNKDVAKIIERCADSILDYEVLGTEGVQFKIDRKAFRGIHCAFRNVK